MTAPKPGELWLVEYDGEQVQALAAGERPGAARDRRYWLCLGALGMITGSDKGTPIRRLAVIDPAEVPGREHLGRFGAAFAAPGVGPGAAAAARFLSAALDEVDPPGPPPLTDEPTDLSARVINKDGAHAKVGRHWTCGQGLLTWRELLASGPLRLAEVE